MQFSSSGFPHKSNNGIYKWRVSFKRNWMKVKNLRIKQRKNTEQMKLYIQRAKMKKLLWHSLFFQQSEQWKFPKFLGKSLLNAIEKGPKLLSGVRTQGLKDFKDWNKSYLTFARIQDIQDTRYTRFIQERLEQILSYLTSTRESRSTRRRFECTI